MRTRRRYGEVAGLSNRVRGIPGFASLLIVALLTGIVTAGLVVAALRYGIPGIMPGVLPR